MPLPTEPTEYFSDLNPHLVVGKVYLPHAKETIRFYAGFSQPPYFNLVMDLETSGPSVSTLAQVHRRTKILKEPLYVTFISSSGESKKYIASIRPFFEEVVPLFVASPLWDISICLSAVVRLYTSLREATPRTPYFLPPLLSSIPPQNALSPQSDRRHAEACLNKYLTKDIAKVLLQHPHSEVRLATISALGRRALLQSNI